jgi:hypothetical protein
MRAWVVRAENEVGVVGGVRGGADDGNGDVYVVTLPDVVVVCVVVESR